MIGVAHHIGIEFGMANFGHWNCDLKMRSYWKHFECLGPSVSSFMQQDFLNNANILVYRKLEDQRLPLIQFTPYPNSSISSTSTKKSSKKTAGTMNHKYDSWEDFCINRRLGKYIRAHETEVTINTLDCNKKPMIISVIDHHYQMKAKDTDVAQTLLEESKKYGILDPKCTDAVGRNVLIAAVEANNIALVECVLNYPYQNQLKDPDQFVRSLIDHENNDGNTALDIAVEKKFQDIAQMIIDKIPDYQDFSQAQSSKQIQR